MTHPELGECQELIGLGLCFPANHRQGRWIPLRLPRSLKEL